MKFSTKIIKNQRMEREICDKHQKEPIAQLDYQFPQENKDRGKALCIFAGSFWSGVLAGKEIERRRIK